jgi:hypothetical protein
VLLDHNLPHKVRTSLGMLGGHQIVTASYMGWGGLTDGELLRTAEDEGFGVFVTGDQSFVHERTSPGAGWQL